MPLYLADRLAQVLERGERTKGREKVAHLAADRIALRIIGVYRELVGEEGAGDSSTLESGTAEVRTDWSAFGQERRSPTCEIYSGDALPAFTCRSYSASPHP